MVPLDKTVFPMVLSEKYLDEPILVIRNQEGKLYCVTNVCTHRGNLVIHHPGKQKNLTCMYHGRRFNLDGSFKSMPEFEGAKDFLGHVMTYIGFQYILG